MDAFCYSYLVLFYFLSDALCWRMYDCLAQSGGSALIYAVQNGHTDCVKLLVDCGADSTNTVDPAGIAAATGTLGPDDGGGADSARCATALLQVA